MKMGFPCVEKKLELLNKLDDTHALLEEFYVARRKNL
jgi:hypothetical protein